MKSSKTIRLGGITLPKPNSKKSSKKISRQLLIVASVCDTVGCSDGICDIPVPCAGIDFGKRIVKLFIARIDAADFVSTTSLNTQADWATRLAYSCTGVNKQDRIIAVGDVHDGLKPKSDIKTEEAPYGGDETVERKQMITFNIKRWDAALIDGLNAVRCLDKIKFWYLTDTGYLFGDVTGFQNVTAIWGDLEHPGAGNRIKSENTFSWLMADQSKPVYNPWLATMTN